MCQQHVAGRANIWWGSSQARLEHFVLCGPSFLPFIYPSPQVSSACFPAHQQGVNNMRTVLPVMPKCLSPQLSWERSTWREAFGQSADGLSVSRGSAVRWKSSDGVWAPKPEPLALFFSGAVVADPTGISAPCSVNVWNLFPSPSGPSS